MLPPTHGRGLLLAAAVGQSCGGFHASELAGARSPHPRVPHQNSCYGKGFVDYFFFYYFPFLFLSFFFFLPVNGKDFLSAGSGKYN